MEELSFDSILNENEIEDLLTEPEEAPVEEPTGKNKGNEEEKGSESPRNNETKNTTEVDPEDLFGEEDGGKMEKPESVGSGKDTEGEKEGSVTDDGGGTSPENFYSSIATAMAEDGIFPNLDEETVKKANDAESLSNLFEAEVMARLDDVQQRIKKALDNGVEVSDIRKYENTLNYISSIKEAELVADDEKGEQLRSRIIYQDYLNKGISPEKAQKLTQRTIDAGTDVEDAREALQSNKEFFQNAYNKLLQDAQAEAEAARADRKAQETKLKDSILKDKTLMGDTEISQDIRKKAFENLSKPVYRDPETGDYLTAIQRYEMEHRADFLKYVSLFYTLTDGFKDFKSFTKGQVKKEVKKGLRELEQTLSNTRRNSDGSLRMVTNQREDPESFIGGNFKLAL